LKTFVIVGVDIRLEQVLVVYLRTDGTQSVPLAENRETG